MNIPDKCRSRFYGAAFLACILAYPCFAGRAASAEAPAPVISLNEHASLAGQWKIRLGDEMQFASPEYNDAAWDTFSLPGSMILYAVARNDAISGVLWIRKTVPIDRGLARENIGLILGRIGNADETYFNGEKIGSTGGFPPHELSMWNHPRYYTIPRSLVRYGGANVIAVRISYFVYAEVRGEMALAAMEDWGKSKALANFFIIHANYIIIAMGLPILLIFLIFYLRRRASKEYLFYCLQLLCGLFILLELCTYWDLYGSMLMRFKILAFSWAAINVVHPIFLHRFYMLKRRRIENILWSYLIIVAVSLPFIRGGLWKYGRVCS